MSNYTVKIKKLSLPVIAIKGIVAFPGAAISFEINDDMAIKAAEAAFDTDSLVLICAYRDPNTTAPLPAGLFRVGTVCKIKQSVRNTEGGLRVLAEGFSRATVTEFRPFADYLLADVNSKTHTASDDDKIKNQAYCRAMLTEAKKLASLLPSVSDDMLTAASAIKTPALLADFIASNMLVKTADKQMILECFDPEKRIELLIALLEEEAELLACELEIHKRVRSNLNQNQKEYYLREQIRVIKNELGDGDEIEEYFEKIAEAKLPDEVREKLMKETDRMSKAPFGSAEATVARTYLDTCLEIPWSVQSKDRVNISAAKKILDADHDGLDKVKERILEFLAVKQLNPSLGNQILCLVGPPGVGKTSIAASIARALGRKYARISLGGVRDEADIRGHRKTYVGAMPGRIVSAITTAKSKNPVIVLDEIDKLSRDLHGDPSSALLEVLDPEQNKFFRDHFLEMPLDLSDCLFIATANYYEGIPEALIDRMEIIEVKPYSRTEKLNIALTHLVPKQLKRHGLTRRMLTLTEDAILKIIDCYTREAGVRNLERELASLFRKCARAIADGSAKRLTVRAEDIISYLGKPKHRQEPEIKNDEVGIVNGLAYTSTGGDLLRVEVLPMAGTGKLELTGSLGDVMKESARIAVSCVRARAEEFGISHDFTTKKDLHIHFPEGAIPKDGPSAGVTMVTALVSALSGIPVRHDVAMTGEITLHGKVLPIGGLTEKTMAAYRAGIKTVLIPRENERDLDEIDREAAANLHFVLCDTVDDVLENALASKAAALPIFEGRNEASVSELPLSIPPVSSGMTVTATVN